jgi:methylamine dehydrogenase heavy chain
MIQRLFIALLFVCASAAAQAQEWDSIVGAVAEVGEPTPHWFTVRGRQSAYLIDGDTAEVQGTLTLSMFSPALAPDIERNRIYAYGSFYTRTYYGERTDVVLFFDATTMLPVKEVEIPAKSAGIGHSGMIGLVNDRYLGVWNITPAMSVSIVDVEDEEFVAEISTAGCAMVYPLEDGFLMPCGDGTLQYITLDRNGEEASRVRSDTFFDVEEDAIFDYAVPTADGWMFLSFDGLVFTASIDDGEVVVSDPWSIFQPATDDEASPDEGWRIGGRQPFAFNAATGVLVTLMHEGGGQETFEDPGTEIWGFNVNTQRRGYRLVLPEEDMATGLQMTADEEPLLLVSPDESNTLGIYNGTTGRLLREMPEMGGLMQNLLPAP